MSQRRTLILIAAIAVGALASFLVWNYVGGIQDQAYSDAERVKVFLVSQPIPRGTPGNVAQEAIEEESIPRKFKPANAITSRDDIAGQVAKSDLVANQVVVQDMFVEADDPSAQQSFAENLTKIRNEDQTTFTMNVDDVRGVAGLIVPGDYVNILVTNFQSVAATDDSSGGGGGAQSLSDTEARYLYQKVQVLAVGKMTAGAAAPAADSEGGDGGGDAQATQAGTITLIVPAKATQVLASIPAENIYLSLVGKDYEPVPQGPADFDPLPAEDASRITPYGPDGARKSD